MFEYPVPTKQIKQSQSDTVILYAQTEIQTICKNMKSDTYFKPSEVNTVFLDLKYLLQNILQSCNTQAMLEQCEHLMASSTNNIFLLCSDHLQRLKQCKYAPALIQMLSPYFNWSDHSVLAAVVKACKNPDASNLLDQFDSKVDLSLPVTDYPIPRPSPNMIPYDASPYTVLAIKLNVESKIFTLQNVFDVRIFLQEKFQLAPHAFQLLAVTSIATFYWRIPKSIVSVIFSSIAHQCSYLQNKGIVELSVYPGLMFLTTDSLKVGSLSFFTPTDHLVRDTVSLLYQNTHIFTAV